jgi:hypothetical protein
MILLLIKPHTCPGRWIYLALFSVSAPLCQKIEPKSIMIVCLSLPTFPVLLGLTLSPASDGLGGSGLGGPPLAVPQSAWPVPLRLGAVCLFRSALALASSRSDPGPEQLRARARNRPGTPRPGLRSQHEHPRRRVARGNGVLLAGDSDSRSTCQVEPARRCRQPGDGL